MRISMLLENTAKNNDFAAEHGLSMYIETEQGNILFDTGATSLFAQNAAKLGIDLADVDMVVISHGHNDHGGGLKTFLELNSKAKIYITPQAFGRYYNDGLKDISIDASLLSTGRFVLVEDSLKLTENMELLTCNKAKARCKINAYGLMKVENGQLVTDDFKHEQYLVIKEKGKRVVFSGCSHKGIINIVEWLSPDVLIGGFHFMRIEDEGTLQAAAEELNKQPIDFYTCHCTGVKQYEFLQTIMPKLYYLSCGDVLNI